MRQHARQVRSVLLVVASAALAGNVLVAAGIEPRAEGTLTIALQFDRSISSTSLRAMEREAEEILSPAAHVRWELLSQVKAGESFERVVVLHFTGSCDLQARAPRGLTPSLGHTNAAGHELLPFSEIDCDALRTLLTSRTGSMAVGAGAALGVGLGRVLAHEVYHIVLNTTAHSRCGVAKASFSAADLFAKPLRFERADLERLNAALAGTPATTLLSARSSFKED